jgi:hypothetical protein
LDHLTYLQLSFIEKYNAAVATEEARKAEQRVKLDSNAHLRSLSLEPVRRGKKLSLAEVSRQHASMGVRNVCLRWKCGEL